MPLNVMAGLVPAIHVLAIKKDVDARHKAGHDERKGYGDTSSRTLPFVSIANAPVTMAAMSAAVANIQNTDCKPPPIM